MNLVLKEENIATLIYFIRGEKVLLDGDLALMYGVETKVLKQAVKRNIDRFPQDFMFELTQDEFESFKVTICDLKKENLKVNYFYFLYPFKSVV